MIGGPSGTTGNPISLKNIPQADTQAWNMSSSLAGNNPLAALTPQYSGVVSNIMNNPYASLATGAAPTAMAMGENSALGAYGLGQNFTGAAGDVLNTAFDPQNALYNRTAQQTADQLRAANYAAGVGSSPYGAGLEGQGMANFNIDWQNNLLNRMAMGATAAEGLGTTGATLGQNATGLFQNSSMIPYAVSNSISQDKLAALDALSQANTNQFNVSQSGLQDLFNYLNMGNQYNATGIQQEQQNLKSSATATDALGSGLGALTSFIGLFM